MGCCSSKNTDSRASRIARWRSTGIVALRDFKLKTFPDEVLNLERSVRTLDLTHKRLVDVPMEISKLIDLRRLILADNLIERLPVNLGKLQSLKVMTLDGNKVTTLPDELGQLVKLERLSISGNLLIQLPETIGSLRNGSKKIKKGEAFSDILPLFTSWLTWDTHTQLFLKTALSRMDIGPAYFENPVPAIQPIQITKDIKALLLGWSYEACLNFIL